MCRYLPRAGAAVVTEQGRKALTELLNEARKDQRFAALIRQTEEKS